MGLRTWGAVSPAMADASRNDEAWRVDVAVEAPLHGLAERALSYRSERRVPAGSLIRVPLGRREVAGIVWDADHDTDDATRAPAELRSLLAVFDALPPLLPAWRALVGFAAGYYQRSIGEVALGVLPPALRTAEPAALARRIERLHRAPDRALPTAGAPVDGATRALTDEQQAALAAIADADRPVLLHGVTGSGKTEVYLQAVERALERGAQALLLVPEINLTPQFEQRLATRFPQRRVVSLHSGLTPVQRLNHWLLAHLGVADVVLGTRLAVFASLPRLGLIVVDEEHDPSFKQQEGARYSARDLAVWRATHERCTVVLGSATPSLESWQRTLRGAYRRVALDRRVGGGAMPRVVIVDQGALPRDRAGERALAPALLDAVESRLARGEQSLLLLNRRGWAPVLACAACGWKSACPHCSAWRVFHRRERTLRCHHCGSGQPVPRACPDCGNLDIDAVGRGTERLAAELAQQLPAARIGRIDGDSVRGAGRLQQQLQAVHAGDVDVLVGTQMVAKGHDFRRVTLVAAVNPDAALFGSDFRGPERLFALLMQAAGRAGRDARHAATSEMWVQTRHPQHPLFAALRSGDYVAFATGQLDERRRAGLPPFSALALLRADARQADDAERFLAAAATVAGDTDGITLYPPVPPPLARLADVERMQMLVESPSRTRLQRMLAAWLPQLHALRAGHKGVLRWAIDVDPAAI